MVKTPSKSTAATVAETAAKVMRKGRSKKKSAKEPEDEEDGDRVWFWGNPLTDSTAFPVGCLTRLAPGSKCAEGVLGPDWN